MTRCLALLAVLLPAMSVAQTVDWTQSYGSNNHLLPQGITSDSSGNYYIVFTVPYSPGPLQRARGPYANSPSYLPSRAFRVIKYNSSGTVQWNVLYTTNHDYFIFNPVGIEVDSSGNVFVGGSYWATETPDLGPTFEENVYFMVKYNSSGTLQNSYFTADNADPDTATAMTIDSTGEYVTGKEGSSMYTVKFNTSASGTVWTTKTTGGGEGTCLTVSGSDLVVGGSVPVTGGRDYGVWVLSTSTGSISNSGTYGVNHKSGDTLKSVAVGSDGTLYGTGTTQAVVSSVLVNNTTTVKYASLSSLSSPAWSSTLAGSGAIPAPSGISGADGGKQVLVDPNSGDPIVLGTVGQQIKVAKLSASTGGTSWSVGMQEVTSGKPPTYWYSDAVGMKISSNGALFVCGTSWYDVTGYSHFVVAKMTLSGSYTWGPSWQYVSGQNQVIASGLTVYSNGGTDYVGVTGGVYSNNTQTRIMH